MKNLVGQIIANRYRIDELIGRGGMAEVYKVWDQNWMVYLAMKLLHEDLALDKVFLRRFQREAQNLSKLQHPNIVRFYGLEKAPYQAFILMEYVEGVTLKHKIYAADKRGMKIEEICSIFRDLCSALRFAHSEGIIHCDIKPGNVMIKPDDTVLLADFGIARLTDAATATMVGAGTPAYMAPEQVKGLDPVPQTDIYALGVILYEMLTGGERPFTGETATATGTTSAKVRWEQVHLDPPSPRIYQPDISSDLERIVLKCLAKEPNNRYQNTTDLLNELETAIQKVSESSRWAIDFKDDNVTTYIPPKSLADPVQPQQSRIEPVRKESKPKRSLWGVWVGLAAVVALGVIIGSGITRPKPPERMVITATRAAATSTPKTSTSTPVPNGASLSTDLGGREITIAVENAYLPFNYIDPSSGNPAGWDYDVWGAICEEINCTPVFVETAWEGMIQAVADGQFDAAGDGITITKERAEGVDFSIGYLNIDQRLLVRKNESRFQNIDDIVTDTTLKLGTQAGTTNYAAAEAYLPTNRIQAFEQFPFAVQSLLAGDIDAVIIDEVAGQGYLGYGADQLKIVGPPIFADQLGFIFPKSSDLVNPVNLALTRLRQNGFLDEVNAYYFGPNFNITYDDLFQD